MPWKRALVGVVALYLALQLYSVFVISGSGGIASRWTAATLYGALKLFGQSPTIAGFAVRSNETLFWVLPECTVFAPLALFAAGVLAFPARASQKMRALALGTLVLTLLNLVRLLSLFVLTSLSPEKFEVAHLLVWQPIMVVAALGLFGAWAYRVQRRA